MRSKQASPDPEDLSIDPKSTETLPLLESKVELEVDQRPMELSKRERRRAKEVRKKAEAGAEMLATKEPRKAAKNATKDKSGALWTRTAEVEADHTARVALSKPLKGRTTPSPCQGVSDDDVAKVVDVINEKRIKMVAKWGDQWKRESRGF
jgi:DnaJ family protein A protein 5